MINLVFIIFKNNLFNLELGTLNLELFQVFRIKLQYYYLSDIFQMP